MKILIERFKSIERAEIELDSINVLVGGNNAGKSSIIHAIQFAVSCSQILNINSKGIFKKGDRHNSTVSPEELFYSPIKNVYALGYNNKLLTQAESRAILVCISEGQESAKIIIKKGKNANISVTLNTNPLANDVWSIEKPFSMYVPGLAGIPFEEEFKAFGAVRRSAARGDSNSIFRNILLSLQKEGEQWSKFVSTLRTVFPNISIDVKCDLDYNAIVNTTVSFDNNKTNLPIDAMGTGILQAIQICAYIYLFKPRILLLDEPDSHLHPNNQIAMANILIELTQNLSTKIILATHSRTLIRALKSSAKFFRVNQGTISEDFDEYSILLELGAIDDIDRIKSGQYRWIVLTEDTKVKSQQALKYVLEANGLSEGSYRIYPYTGADQLNTAVLTAGFICDLNPIIKVLIHSDRDGRDETEKTSLIEKHSSKRIKLFITKGNDIETYFCCPNHILTVLKQHETDCDATYVMSAVSDEMSALKKTSLEKMITNRCKYRRTHNDQGKIAMEATDDYDKSPWDYVYGKDLRGRLAKKFQAYLGRNVDLFCSTEYLKDNNLLQLINETEVT